mmetsp:Transcript_2294/g.3944  ORF Transcript_2294/g.3944 Transcript_2294/m.3944 type:complete len:242 (+) Transcript_2294:873-1598(+)
MRRIRPIDQGRVRAGVENSCVSRLSEVPIGHFLLENLAWQGKVMVTIPLCCRYSSVFPPAASYHEAISPQCNKPGCEEQDGKAMKAPPALPELFSCLARVLLDVALCIDQFASSITQGHLRLEILHSYLLCLHIAAVARGQCRQQANSIHKLELSLHFELQQDPWKLASGLTTFFASHWLQLESGLHRLTSSKPLPILLQWQDQSGNILGANNIELPDSHGQRALKHIVSYAEAEGLRKVH